MRAAADVGDRCREEALDRLGRRAAVEGIARGADARLARAAGGALGAAISASKKRASAGFVWRSPSARSGR